MPRQVKPSLALRPSSLVKEISLCLFSAALLILSFPDFNLWIFAWFGFVPLFFVLKNKSKTRVFFLSYLCGVIFWLGTIYWLVHVTLIGTILLVLYLALYFGIFGLIISNYTLYAIRSTLIIPSVWVLLEYLRSHLLTGFPWALLGYSQYRNLPVIQIADITGAEGVSFLVMLVNTAVYTFLISRSSFLVRVRKCVIPLLAVVIVLAYGYHKIHEPRTTSHEPRIKISVIQGNIPQELKWDPDSSGYILDKYFQLTKKAAGSKPDLIVWPEAASPALLNNDSLTLREILNLSQEAKTPLLIGAVVVDSKRYFNSALLVSDNSALSRYNKLHLVPFGEYIPLKNVFPFLETIAPIGDITPGKEYTIFTPFKNPLLLGENTFTPSAKRQAHSAISFSALICFEDLFPQISREFVKRGADFLVNITNDAWYKRTSAPYQHLQASVFRAVENRVYLARAANTGVSGFIGPTGEIISLVGDSGRSIFIDGFDTQDIVIPEKKKLSFYTCYGDIFIFINLAYFIAFAYFAGIKQLISLKSAAPTDINKKSV